MYSEIEQMGSPRAKTIKWRPNFYTNVFSTSLDKVNHVQIINLILSHKSQSSSIQIDIWKGTSWLKIARLIEITFTAKKILGWWVEQTTFILKIFLSLFFHTWLPLRKWHNVDGNSINMKITCVSWQFSLWNTKDS